MTAEFCGGCGAPVADDVRFCTNCGRPVRGRAPQPQPPAAGRYVAPSALPPIEPRRSHKKTWLVVGAVVVCLVLLAVAGKVVQATTFDAKASVNGYFDSLASGDAKGALARLYGYDAWGSTDQTKRVASTVLLSDKVLRNSSYRAPKDPRITSIRPFSRSAEEDAGGKPPETQEAKVSYTVGGRRQHATLYLQRSDETTYGLFHRWLIIGGAGGLALNPGTPYLVNGVQVGTSTSAAPSEDAPQTDVYPVFLGSYSVGIADNPLLSADSVTVDVRRPGVQVAATGLKATIEKDAVTEVRKQVDAYLDDCAKQASFTPENCPFSTYGSSDAKNISWTITRYPSIQLSLNPQTNAVGAYTEEEGGTGVATVTYESKDYFSGSYSKQTSTASISVAGPVVVNKGKIDWLSPADLAHD